MYLKKTQGVVHICCIIIIDGDGWYFTKIHSFFEIFFRDLGCDLISFSIGLFLCHIDAKGMRKIILKSQYRYVVSARHLFSIQATNDVPVRIEKIRRPLLIDDHKDVVTRVPARMKET